MKRGQPEAHTCPRCGQSWVGDIAWKIPCPVCEAGVGQPCIRPSGHSGPAIDIHMPRQDALLKSGLVLRCPCVIEWEEAKRQKKAERYAARTAAAARQSQQRQRQRQNPASGPTLWDTVTSEAHDQHAETTS